jgi:hypothetical protein
MISSVLMASGEEVLRTYLIDVGMVDDLSKDQM